MGYLSCDDSGWDLLVCNGILRICWLMGHFQCFDNNPLPKASCPGLLPVRVFCLRYPSLEVNCLFFSFKETRPWRCGSTHSDTKRLLRLVFSLTIHEVVLTRTLSFVNTIGRSLCMLRKVMFSSPTFFWWNPVFFSFFSYPR
jgi:hypothetical protein